MTLDELLEELRNYFKDQMREVPLVMTVALAEGHAPDGEIVRVLIGVDPAIEGAQMVAMAIRGALRGVGVEVERVATFAEAWGANLSSEDPDTRRVLSGEIRISDLPEEKRKDVVFFYAEERDARVLRSYQIVSGRTDLLQDLVSTERSIEERIAFWPLLKVNMPEPELLLFNDAAKDDWPALTEQFNLLMEMMPPEMGRFEGAWPDGSRVKKVQSEPGDGHPDGDLGSIVRPFGIPDQAAYAVLWDGCPAPVFTLASKLELVTE